MKTTQKKCTYSAISMTITSFVLITLMFILRDEMFASQIPFIWSLFFVCGLFLYEIISILIVNKEMKTGSSKQLANSHMILKGIKFFLFVLVALIYAVFVKQEANRFFLFIVVVYFIYLVLDTICLFIIENKKKKCNG